MNDETIRKYFFIFKPHNFAGGSGFVSRKKYYYDRLPGLAEKIKKF